MRTFQATLVAILLASISMSSLLMAAVPGIVSYQGRLTTATGTPVPDGSQFLRFQIYGVASGGTSLWDSQIRVVQVKDGLFTYKLGQDVPFPDDLFASGDRWLGITVGADPELSPRTLLVAVPYAYRIATVDGASGGEISGMVSISGVEEGLRLQGTSTGPANSTWLSFRDGAGTHIGYVGDGSSSDQDMYLASYVGKVHIYTAAGPAITSTTTGNVGMGTTTPSQLSRLHVLGGAFGTSIYGQITTAGGTALYGQAAAISGVGVLGSATGSNTIGVWGFSNVGYAGYFSGDVGVNGTLSKLAGSFKIDHPLDPANKYLSHSFVESPDMKNIYDGMVTLDAKGEALVQLPEWFAALNKDFRYQLTCVGGYAPVYIAEEVYDNRFRIAGGTANLSVSWQVTGIRRDAYANAHRIQVEEMKPEIERGFYLTPEVLGYPAEKQIDWARRPELMRQLRDTLPSASGKR